MNYINYIEYLKGIVFFENTVYDYIVALLIFVGFILILKIFQVIVLARLRHLAKKTKTDLDDIFIQMFENIKPPFYFFIALYFSIKALILAEVITKVIMILVLVAVVYEIIVVLEKVLGYFIGRYLNSGKKDNAEKIQNEAMTNTIRLGIKVLLWLVGLIIILSNLGIDVTGLVASLGIGGIAIALALQNVLSDMFSSFSIYIDKPFKIGDTIMIGADMGTVEKIGLKTTRIKTLQGEELVVSNQELTTARIQNFGKMERRRVLYNLGVVYGTPQAKMEKIPEMIKKIVDDVKNVDFDRCHFKTYGDFSLNFEVVYYVNSSEYNEYMNLNQKINLDIYKAFEKEKIEFAYPTQTVYMEK